MDIGLVFRGKACHGCNQNKNAKKKKNNKRQQRGKEHFEKASHTTVFFISKIKDI
jgi:hypothetical protein